MCRVMPEAYQKDKDFLAKHPQGYEGFVSRLMPTADRAKGAIPVRVRDQATSPRTRSGKYLRPDMGALVSFMRGTARSKDDQPETNADDTGRRSHRSLRYRSTGILESDCPMNAQPIVRVEDLRKFFTPRHRADRRPREPHPRRARGRIPRPHGAVRLRQDDAAEPHRRARPAQHGPHRRRRGRHQPHERGAAGQLADPARRLRLPVLPPAARADRLRERRAAAAAVAAVGGPAHASRC